ncbi:hypothetical protein BurJ1DRAFT_1945 [Burkholderiales bacterium JOSHI_001]|nr:hypothetical protein BurJ1DRAFT_1945 [Burkholderiales bacterium JOSHI_001]
MTLDEAKLQAEQYGTLLHGLRLKVDARRRVALACFAIAQQHHSAILILMDRPAPLHATAFALLRPLMEATLRGEWVLHCASDEQVTNFALGGRSQMDMASVIRALEKLHPESEAHRILYQDNWKIFSAYTHTYEHQVQHWLADAEVCPSYRPDQIAWLLNAGTNCFRLCVSSVQSMVAQ